MYILKISHVDKEVIEDLLKNLNDKFENESLLTTSCGQVLEYLSITIDYRQKVKAEFAMYYYVLKMLEELPLDMQGTENTPETSNLFKANPERKNLDEEQRQLFHSAFSALWETVVIWCARVLQSSMGSRFPDLSG